MSNATSNATARLGQTQLHLIGGKLQQFEQTLDVTDPATGEVPTTVADGGTPDVDAAVAAAPSAQLCMIAETTAFFSAMFLLYYAGWASKIFGPTPPHPAHGKTDR